MDRKFGMKVECCSEWSCGGSRRSSASSSSCCQGFRQLAVVAPLSPGGTSCSLVVWLSTGCSFSAGLPGDVHDTCWVKMVASLLLHSNSDFLSPICLRNSYHGFKHVSNASQTARMSHFTRQFFFMSCMHETVSVSPQCRSGNNKWIMGINARIVHTLIVVKFLLIGFSWSTVNPHSLRSPFFSLLHPPWSPCHTHFPVGSVTYQLYHDTSLSELQELMRKKLKGKTKESICFKWPPSPSYTSLTPDQWSRCKNWTHCCTAVCSHTHIYF